MANTAKGTAVHNDITANAYVSPTAPNKKVILSQLVAKGVVTTAGAYVGGKGQADLEKLLAVRDPVTEVMASVVNVTYGL